MTRLIRPLHLVPDVERHGVTRYARELAAACGCAVTPVAPSRPGQPLHLHFTDRIWGTDPGAAAARISELAEAHPVSVTLHDLPQASDGAASQQRRSGAYAQVVTAASAVVVNSRWEAQLLAAFAAPGPPPTIIPLTVQAMTAAPPRPGGATSEPTIGLLGFVYPGKGHAEAIEAAAACASARGTRVGVLALGAVSTGHAPEAAALADRARRLGVDFSVTGYLTDGELTRRARQVTVPLAAHQHVSASASVGSWLSAGRRPLVLDSPYAREIDALRPGTIQRCDPAELTEAVMQTLADPPASWLPDRADLRPGPAETAGAYLRWWTQAVRW